MLKRATRICLDVLLFVAICCLALTLSRWVEPHRRGFFCQDASLQYPYRENTVSTVTLLALVLCVPSLVILMLELVRSLRGSGATNDNAPQRQQPAPNEGYRLGHRLLQFLAQLGYYLFGVALTLLAVETGKLTVGRPRPHFFSVCQPQLTDGSSCADAQNHDRFIEQYRCAGVGYTASTLQQLNKSFPSGHAALSFYAMIYTAIYVQQELSTRFSKLFKHLLQFGVVLLAWYISLTRVSDFWHHWSDVLAGALLGALLATCVSLYVAQLGATGRSGKPPLKPVAKSAAAAAVLPAYTFGSMSYLHHPQQQYAQSYHNYGYVP